jgi:hypothetical protein
MHLILVLAALINGASAQTNSSGKFVHPVSQFQGFYNSSFGMRIDPFLRSPAMHTGMDLAADMGTPVLAAKEGVVRVLPKNGAYGETVEIEHGNGLVTRYAHMAGAGCVPGGLKTGAKVKAGQQIGCVASTGRSTGPHLHFEILEDGEKKDPADYLDGYKFKAESLHEVAQDNLERIQKAHKENCGPRAGTQDPKILQMSFRKGGVHPLFILQAKRHNDRIKILYYRVEPKEKDAPKPELVMDHGEILLNEKSDPIFIDREGRHRAIEPDLRVTASADLYAHDDFCQDLKGPVAAITGKPLEKPTTTAEATTLTAK